MKAIENTSENKNYTAINIGSLEKLMEHSIHSPQEWAGNKRESIRQRSDESNSYGDFISKENSLEEHTSDDGERVVCEPKWRRL